MTEERRIDPLVAHRAALDQALEGEKPRIAAMGAFYQLCIASGLPWQLAVEIVHKSLADAQMVEPHWHDDHG